MGIPVFKYFGDLTPEEVFNLFRHFAAQHDYNTSLFKSSVNNKSFLCETKDEDEVNEEDILVQDIDQEILE